MLPRLVLAAGLALAGLAATATPALAYEVICVAPPMDTDEEPILPSGIKVPRQACVPLLVDIPPAP